MTRKTRATRSVAALRQQNERLKRELKYYETQYRRIEAFLKSAPLVAYIKNGQREYAYFNPVRQRQLGLEPDDILWHTDRDLAGNLGGIASHEHDGRVLDSNQPAENLEAALDEEHGTRNWLVVRFPFRGPDGEPCVGAVGLDVSRCRLE